MAVADIYVRSQVGSTDRQPGVWSRLATVLGRRKTQRPPWSCTCSETPPKAVPTVVFRARRPAGGVPTTPTVFGSPPPSILNDAYIASVLELALKAQSLTSGATRLHTCLTDLHALSGEVVEMLHPLAQVCGLKVVRDASPSRADGWADPEALYVVLSYLILRTLTGVPAPGHIRIMVTASACEAQILILSPLSHVVGGEGGSTPEFDLNAAHGVLRAMGGALVLEPRRAGYSPLSVTFRSTPPLPLRRAT